MVNPNASHYLSTYPAAVKLWLAGKHQEAAHAFVKSPCQIIVKGEAKADHFGYERQAVVNELKGPKFYEAVTDALCKGYRALQDSWPHGYGERLEDCSVAIEILREINRRRDRWRELYGIHAKAKRARQDAIRLKRFVRTMRLMKKQA